MIAGHEILSYDEVYSLFTTGHAMRWQTHCAKRAVVSFGNTLSHMTGWECGYAEPAPISARICKVHQYLIFRRIKLALVDSGYVQNLSIILLPDFIARSAIFCECLVGWIFAARKAIFCRRMLQRRIWRWMMLSFVVCADVYMA